MSKTRRVPPDWQHPKDAQGRYIPKAQGFAQALRRWESGLEHWVNGYREDHHHPGLYVPHRADRTTEAWVDWHGQLPNPDHYMPDFPEDECTAWVWYEDTSEGTPMSPVFPTVVGLAEWIVKHGWAKDLETVMYSLLKEDRIAKGLRL